MLQDQITLLRHYHDTFRGIYKRELQLNERIDEVLEEVDNVEVEMLN
jgi:hypothetical protein